MIGRLIRWSAYNLVLILLGIFLLLLVFVPGIGAGIGAGLAVVGTVVALKLTGLVAPLRLNERDEVEGMDLAIHGEEGYSN